MHYFVNISSYQNINQETLPVQTLSQNSPPKQTSILIFSSILHTLPPLDQLIGANRLHNIWVRPSAY